MNTEGLIELVGVQSKSFHELETQSYRLIRILIAIAALTIGFTQTELFANLIAMEIPEKEVTLVGGGATEKGFYRVFARAHLLVAGGLGGIFVLLIIDSAVWAFRVLKVTPIEPSMENSHEQPLSVAIASNSVKRSHLAYWIQSNQYSLQLANHRIQNAYRRIAESALMLSFAFLTVLGIYLPSPYALLMVDIFLLIFAAVVLSVYFRDLSLAISGGWNDETITVRSALQAEFSRIGANTPTFPIAVVITCVYFLIMVIGVLFGGIWIMSILV